MKMRTVLAGALFLAVLTQVSLAQTFACSVKDNGYAHSLEAALGNMNEQLDTVKSWIPEEFKVSKQGLAFKNEPVIALSGGNGENVFKVRLRSDTYNVEYEIIINEIKKSGTVYMREVGYKPMGPVFFSCLKFTQTPKVQSAEKRSEPIKKEKSLLHRSYTRLTEYQRKQTQTILKKLGLYKFSVDGLYGNGTKKAYVAFNDKYLGGLNLNEATNVNELISSVLNFDSKPAQPDQKVPTEERNKYLYVASGTGFFVSKEGHIITNQHVINGCQKTKVHKNGAEVETIIIASDDANDLALLKTSLTPEHVFALSGDSVYPLQDIIVAGFPFGTDISSSLKFTRGVVSSLTGIGNNYSEIQIDAALQPGNSGGPILDDYGNIVGVAVAKLDLGVVLENYGVIPENTNFGIKKSVVKNLIEANRVPVLPPNDDVVSKRTISQNAMEGTVLLSCWMTKAQIENMKSKKVMLKEIN